MATDNRGSGSRLGPAKKWTEIATSFSGGPPGMECTLANGVIRLAFMGRTSTDDQQDPTISIPRQFRACLVGLPTTVVIAVNFYDVECGRSDLSQRGRGRSHEQFEIPVPRDGGIQDLLEEARRSDRRFDAVICESIERIARRAYYGLVVEQELEDLGVPLLASDEPVDFADLSRRRATQVLTRRIKQGVAEWYVLEMLEKSWAGFEEHTVQGYNIGSPPYGYLADKVPHPVPAKRAEGKTKTRLVPDPHRADVVVQIFTWRVQDRLSYRGIAERLNQDLARYPPPMPPDRTRAVGEWTLCSVRGVLTNPKYTGHMVWNRRARKSRNGKPNSPSEWVCSAQPTHPALVTVETFVLAGQVAAWRHRSRSGGEVNAHRQARRSYVLRSFVFCAWCGWRMYGKTRDRPYYACTNTARNTRTRQHPGTLWAREDTLLRGLDAFMNTHLVGPDRRSHLDTRLARLSRKRERDRRIRAAQLRTVLGDVDARQRRLVARLEELDDPDPGLVRELQRRYAELSAQRRSVKYDLETLVTDQQQSLNPGLLDLLPTGRISTHVNDQVLRRVFELSRLEIHFDKRTRQARYQATLHPETINTLSSLLARIVVPLEDNPLGGSRHRTSKSRLRGRADVRKLTDSSVTPQGVLIVTATLDLG